MKNSEGRKVVAPKASLLCERLESRYLMSSYVDWLNSLPPESLLPLNYASSHDDQSGPVPLALTPAEYTTILNNGSPSNRVDIVLVGDGYTEADLPTYYSHASTVVNNFFNESPLNIYKPFFNIHRVKVISTQSGVDGDPTQSVTKNTALDMRFWNGGIERALGVNLSKALSYANNAPEVDQILAIANSTKYGGLGYPASNLGTLAGGNLSALEIARHEFGHAFADLADEYTDGGPVTFTGSEPSAPNVSTHNAANLESLGTKWWRWLDRPEVDAFEGANYSQFGIYRSTENSKMRELNQPYGAVNTEQIVLNIYKEVKPIDAATPAGTYSTAQSFFVDPVDPVGNPLSVQWTLDGSPIAGATGLTLNLASLGVWGNHTLGVQVVDDTPLVRDPVIRATWMTEIRSWAIVDTTPPAAASVSSTLASGAYKAGSVVPITVSFSEPVNVIGSPRLTLETGAADGIATYLSGNGTSTLTFTYTVAAGENSPDLDYVSSNCLSLNGGTICDLVGNDAILTLSNPGSPNSLGAQNAIVIDTIRPSATPIAFNYLAAPHAAKFTFSENVSGSLLSTSQLIVENLSTGQIFTEAQFSRSYGPGNSAQYSYLGGMLPNGVYVATLESVGITDLAGNVLMDDVSIDFFILGGDANRDRMVNTADLMIFMSNYMRSGKSFNQGDFNYDGTVDRNDLAILSRNWQEILYPPPPPPPPVPLVPLPHRPPTRVARLM